MFCASRRFSICSDAHRNSGRCRLGLWSNLLSATSLKGCVASTTHTNSWLVRGIVLPDCPKGLLVRLGLAKLPRDLLLSMQTLHSGDTVAVLLCKNLRVQNDRSGRSSYLSYKRRRNTPVLETSRNALSLMQTVVIPSIMCTFISLCSSSTSS